MRDRKSVSDPRLQRSATIAPPAAVREYNDTFRILQKRDSLRPRSAKTLWQAFREDPAVQREVEAEVARSSERDKRTRQELTVSLFEAKTKRSSSQLLSTLREDTQKYNAALQAFSEQQSTKRALDREVREQEKRSRKLRGDFMEQLFEKWKLKPGAMDHFYRLLEQNKLRYAREVKVYREETAPNFDKEYNLVPIEEESVPH